MTHFDIIDLHADRIAEAWPLVRMVAPGVDLERWRSYAAAPRSGGFLGAIAGGGALHGIAAYRFDQDLQRGTMLNVDLFVTCELSPSAPVRAALVAALERVAREHDCAALAVAVPPPRSGQPWPSNAAWSALGFRDATLALVKKVAPMTCGTLDNAASG